MTEAAVDVSGVPPGDRLVDTRDTFPEANQFRFTYAGELVRLGLAGEFGVYVRLVRLGERRAAYGIFVGRHEAPPAGSGVRLTA